MTRVDLRGTGSSGGVAVDEYAPLGQFGKRRVDGIVEPHLVVLHEDERRHRHDRLGHRRDAEDAVAADRCRFSSGELAGDTDLHLIACGEQPCDTANLVAQQRTYRTLERLCAAIADRLLERYDARIVWVKAAKPEPPLAFNVTEVSVEVWREAE